MKRFHRVKMLLVTKETPPWRLDTTTNLMNVPSGFIDVFVLLEYIQIPDDALDNSKSALSPIYIYPRASRYRLFKRSVRNDFYFQWLQHPGSQDAAKKDSLTFWVDPELSLDELLHKHWDFSKGEPISLS
jgi:hypothetical protein